TKQEFVDMILKAGKSMPIDVKLLTKKYIEKQWYITPRNMLIFVKETIEINLRNLEEFNPPRLTKDIIFIEQLPKGSREPDEISFEFANEAISKLRFMKEIEKQIVTIPSTVKHAIGTLTEDPKDYEWGGGMDFEIIKGKPQIERLLAYFGEEGTMPWRVIKKYGNDVEVRFHTHPGVCLALPSKTDVSTFINSKQQVSIIFSECEILVMEKTRQTPKIITMDEITETTPDINSIRASLIHTSQCIQSNSFHSSLSLVLTNIVNSFSIHSLNSLSSSEIIFNSPS
ncbi:unnamed protein product, partial [marine sediment metagenome]